MVDPDDGETRDARPPTVEDLLNLCRRLNATGAKYIVIGGMAIIQHGFPRSTEDIDLLVDSSSENFQRIRTAMLGLPDGAIREMEPGDLDKYIVVRVGDEFVVDLMKAACGIEYAEASQDVSRVSVQDVVIPFANAQLLLRLKKTHREKDVVDRLFLEDLLKNSKK